jgi:hypothetical protein
MRIGSGKLAVLAIAGGLLAGCAAPQSRDGMLTAKQYPSNPVVTPCISDNCPVSVHITLASDPFRCVIKVDPPILDVSGGLARKTITWTITNPNFEWPPWVGLVLPLQFDPDGSDVFSSPQLPTPNSISLIYNRPAIVGNKYAYGVNVRHRMLRKFCSIDPFVQD